MESERKTSFFKNVMDVEKTSDFFKLHKGAL